MLRRIVIGFALLLLTIIAVTQVIDVYNTHFSNDNEQFVVVRLGSWVDPGSRYSDYRNSLAGKDTSMYQCRSHWVANPCGYVSYLDTIGQERTIYVDTSKPCFKESVIAESLPLSCRVK